MAPVDWQFLILVLSARASLTKYVSECAASDADVRRTLTQLPAVASRDELLAAVIANGGCGLLAASYNPRVVKQFHGARSTDSVAASCVCFKYREFVEIAGMLR